MQTPITQQISPNSTVYRKEGPFLATIASRVEIAIDGSLQNYEIIGDGKELDFIRVLSSSKTILIIKNQIVDLEKDAKITFQYLLNYAKISYHLHEYNITIHKTILPLEMEKSPAFIITWKLENFGTTSIKLSLLHLFRFTLGDPYYIFAEYRKGLLIHNRLQMKYHGALWQSIPEDISSCHLWLRDDTLNYQLINQKTNFAENIISTKPSENNQIGFQYTLKIESISSVQLHEAISAGSSGSQARKTAKKITKFRNEATIESLLQSLNAKSQAYFQIHTDYQWLNEYYAICARTVDNIYQINKSLYIVPGHQYPRYYARDSYWQIRGLLYLKRFTEIRKLLSHYFRYQNSDGSFPTSINLDRSKNQFNPDAPDLDSCIFPLLSVYEYYKATQEVNFIETHYVEMNKTMEYILTRDPNNDGWLEQGENQDWADTMYREGNIAYSQAIYYKLLRNMSEIALIINEKSDHDRFLSKAKFIKDNFDHKFWNETHQTYVDHIKSDGTIIPNANQDVCLAICYELTPKDHAVIFLNKLKTECWSKWGPMKQTAYSDYEKYGPKGFYHNGGIWLWSAAFEACARFKLNQKDDGLWIFRKCYEYDFGNNPYQCIYMNPTEWYGGLNGLNQYHNYKQAKNFATGAGAFLWAIQEGFLSCEKVE